jgi:hypothetical protein
VKGLEIGEFLGKEEVDKAVFLGRAAGCQRIGIALTFVRARALGNPNQPVVNRPAQQGVQPPQRQANRLSSGALWRVRGDIQLPQEAEELFFVAADMGLIVGQFGGSICLFTDERIA